MKDYKSTLYVAAGACSYGLLATIVKYANHLGIHTSLLTFLQFMFGFLFLLAFNLLSKRNAEEHKVIKFSSKIKLMVWGISLGLTTTLYYLSIQYIPVSVGIILLMQSIWISLVAEAVLLKKFPSKGKITGVIIVLLGTTLATNLFQNNNNLDYRGIILGFGAGISYALAICASSTVEKELPSPIRSQFLVLGGLLLIVAFWNIDIIRYMQPNALPWGFLIAIFGTILPPLLFTKGIPKTGIAMGNIISSLEIPVSTLSAMLVLQEVVSGFQWFGILLILMAVIIINVGKS
ncbi:DMT family transporter [Sphingobacterium paramultivorum]|uniref:DMT family transporter n=1 Tax=Sphingobacterium paramultivorum TaxID=2886510 RepID=A0A7G5E2H2_9SPHI|nr:DMT family transporter [Sphingobacterium paramultivorum]QMV68197.1 DMT family transporter [Sphingobacterium paramultivorum]WSO17114.1 DMT family transporter [Sphingobacterium paramultivorum]